MPIYEYEHLESPCERGRVFEFEQRISSPPLEECPSCGGPIKRILSRVGYKKNRSDSELRDKGFTKLVRRDDGIYENVTAREGESRYWDRSKPETLPKLEKIIKD